MPDESDRMISPFLGEISWETGCELHFPAGLPGSEQHRRIVPVEIPLHRPLIYLQSASQAGVCFLTLPVLAVYPGFNLHLSEEDRLMLELGPSGLSNEDSPALGTEVLCLALLVPSGPTVRTNLDAPIVVNLHNGRGIQAVLPAVRAGCYRLSESGVWEAMC